MQHEIVQPEHRQVGNSGRVAVPAEVYPYYAGFMGGIIAGAVMTLVMAGWGAFTGRGIWFPVNLIAATVVPGLRDAPVEMLAEFSLVGVVVGTLIHFVLSMGLGFLFATLLPTLPGSAFLWALVVGPLLWFVAQYLALPLVNPRMEALIHVPSFAVAHVAYSLTLGWWVSRTAKIMCCESGAIGIRQMFLGR